VLGNDDDVIVFVDDLHFLFLKVFSRKDGG